MLRKLLVPLDGSALAERALAPAMALAQAAQGDVIFLRVPWVHPVSVDDYSGGYRWLFPDQAQQKTVDEAAAYLGGISQQWAREGVTTHVQVEAGDPASVILDVAARQKVELICMTTHGYSGFTRWMLGSVAERVLRASPCPVMVVREPRPLKHVLITLDGSPLAEQALEPGLEVARRFNARVTLLQVAAVVAVPYDVIYQLEVIEYSAGSSLGDDAIAQAQYYLDGVSEQLGDPGVPLTTEVSDGYPAQRIVDYAAAHNVDLIVMATHGRTGLRRWAYGSVTEKFCAADNARCWSCVRPIRN